MVTTGELHCSQEARAYALVVLGKKTKVDSKGRQQKTKHSVSLSFQSQRQGVFREHYVQF